MLDALVNMNLAERAYSAYNTHNCTQKVISQLGKNENQSEKIKISKKG